MTLTQTKPAQTTHDTVSSRRELTDQFPLRLALAVGALWIVSLYIVFSLAPVPTGEPSTAGLLVGIAFDLSILATLAGFALLQRWGLLASTVGGVVLLVGAAVCSLQGHTGAWLVAQYVSGAAILGVSRESYRRF